MPTGIYIRTKECNESHKGHMVSLETRRKMRQAKLGKKSNHKGVKASNETLIKLRESHLGQKAWNKGTKGLSMGWPKGKKRPEMTGKNNWRWISDRTKLIKKQERNDMAYKEWRKNVWIRDNWKCKINNENCNGRLESHHILNWINYPELRYEVNNGITLCQAHHPKKRAEEKRLILNFQGLVSVSKELICQI